MLINDPEYEYLVRDVATKIRINNQTTLKSKRDLQKAESVDAKIATKILRIADKFTVKLEATAVALGRFDADARLLVWDDIETLTNETNGV